MRRLVTGAGATVVATVITSTPAYAHGVQARADTPVPISVFFYAAAAVIIVSFGALAVGWSKPRWSAVPWRPAPRPLQTVVAAPVV